LSAIEHDPRSLKTESPFELGQHGEQVTTSVSGVHALVAQFTKSLHISLRPLLARRLEGGRRGAGDPKLSRDQFVLLLTL
jgi:hypothetical protein